MQYENYMSFVLIDLNSPSNAMPLYSLKVAETQPVLKAQVNTIEQHLPLFPTYSPIETFFYELFTKQPQPKSLASWIFTTTSEYLKSFASLVLFWGESFIEPLFGLPNLPILPHGCQELVASMKAQETLL